MPDYGTPEPRQQPIIAPDEDGDKRKAQGLPPPARPNWLCINDPKNRESVPVGMRIEMRGTITVESKEAAKKAREAAKKERKLAHDKAIAAAKKIRDKERAKRRKEKEKARLKAKKTPEQMLAMRRKQAAYMRELMAKKRVKKVPEVSSDRIKAFLAASKLNRRQLAVLIGVSETSVDSYCSGHGMCPSALAKFKQLEANIK